jgi:nucleotide-binding universal stress UspA family protein
MFRKILVANDLSEASRPALVAGLTLARVLSAEAAVLYVSVPVYPVNHWYVPQIGDEVATLNALAQREEAAARAKLESDVRAAAGGGSAEIVLRTGQPADVILEVAEERGVDLVVVGTHGRSGVERLLLGSVAEKVSRKARCAVLTVHPEARS